MTNYIKHFVSLFTPQRENALSDQVSNSAGGYLFALDKWARLDRWLILGSEGGTYHASERLLTRDNARTIAECLGEDGPRTIARIVAISESGRTPRNDTAIFALALAAGDASRETRKAALAAIPRVCRTGTDLFHFVRDVQGFRKNDPAISAALLPDMSQWALLRNLGKLTSAGVLSPLSDAAKLVASRLADRDRLARARVHPIAVLSALKVYEQGHGERARERLSWTPVREVVDALNEAFHLAFRNLEPTGKKHLLALDVSGSMGTGAIAGVAGLTPRVAAAAMTMATAHVETDYEILAFTAAPDGFGGKWGGGGPGLSHLSISGDQRLDDVLRATDGLPFGGMDCALPMIWAARMKVEVDTFVIYTDNETWAGEIQPFQALREYRQKMGRRAKLIVVAMSSTGFTIADPTDAGMLDVVGFDAAAPQVMADFTRV
jgi:TROVE domain